MTEADKILVEINGRLGGIEANVKDIRHSLYGNGQPGMVTRLSRLEHQHNTCMEAHKTEKAEKEKLFDKKFLIILTAATIIGPMVYEALKFLAKKII